MATFRVKVRGNASQYGAQPNINFHPASGTPAAMNSVPDMLPGEGPVQFDNVPGRGKLVLNVVVGPGMADFGDKFGTQEFDPKDGAMYIWDLASNTLSEETQPFSEDPQAWISWAKADTKKAAIVAGIIFVAGKVLFGKGRIF